MPLGRDIGWSCGRAIGSPLGGLTGTPYLPQLAYTDAMWQRIFDPIANKGDEIFFQNVSMAANDIKLHVVKDGQRSSYVAKTSYGGDDHNTGGSVVLPGGKVMTVYCSHSEATALRYKVTNETTYPYTLSAERTITKPVGWTYMSYSQIFYLSDGTVRVFSRAYNTGTLQYVYYMFKTTAASIIAGTEVWTAIEVYSRASQRPYPCIRQNPDYPSRLDFLVEGANIAEGTTDLGHFYLDTISGSDKYYKSDGTEIVAALPFDLYTEWTLIASVAGAGIEDYLQVDGGYDANGNPRTMAAYFPTGAATGKTDVQFKVFYWNGSTWTGFRVGTQNNTLIGTGSGTMGCGCFDKIDKNRIWLSETVSGVFQVREYALNQAGGSASLVRTTSTQSVKHDFRPTATGVADYPVAFIQLNSWTNYTTWDGDLHIVGITPITPKLILNLRLLETSGQTLSDSSVNTLNFYNGLDGSVTATDLQFVTGGVSVSSGDGAIMQTGAPADLIGTDFYFAVVANTAGITGTGTHALLARDDGTARQFQFRINNGNLEFLWRKTDLSAVTLVAGAVTTGSTTYKLFSAWMRDGVVKVYVNGTQLGIDGAVALPFNASTATTGVCLGSRLSSGVFANNYPGVIAAARIYRNVDTESQLASLNASMIAQVLADKGIAV